MPDQDGLVTLDTPFPQIPDEPFFLLRFFSAGYINWSNHIPKSQGGTVSSDPEFADAAEIILMKMKLKPIKPKKISDQVFDQLREIIARGSLKPGEQLMPERDLAEALGVSRTTIRNAINRLVTLGLVENRQGQGTFVRAPDSRPNNPLALAMEADDADLEDLLEVRLGLECNSAFLAAKRATQEDIRFLEKSIEEMEKEIAEGRNGTEADVSFHMAIAYASKNPVQVQIMREFYDYLFYGIRENLARLYEDPERTRSIATQHTDIMNAIKVRDPQLAFEKMKCHIGYVLDFFGNK